MPIYEYRCSACDHLSELLLGVNDPAPLFCPSCGAEGTMRKAFAPPAIVFKGSGWAKKDRSASSRRSSASKGDSDGGSSGESSAGESSAGDKPSDKPSDKPAAPASSEAD